MLIFTNRNYYLLISVSVLIPLLLFDQIFLLIPISIALFFVLQNSKQTIIIISFVAIITLTSGLGETQRLIIQVSTIITLLLLFLKSFGFDFPNYPKIPTQILLLIFMILFSIIFSLLFTKYLYVGINQLMRSLIFFLFVYLYYSLLKGLSDIKYFLYALFVGTIIYFGIISYEVIMAEFDIVYLNQKIFIEEGLSFVHRNAIGGFFSINISIVLAFLVMYYLKAKYKLFMYVFVFFLISGLILTNSRAAIMSLIISSAYIFYKENRKALRYLFLLILISLPVLLINSISEIINLYFRLERISTGRDFILETVVKIISNNPLIGFGPAATKFEMYNYIPYMFGTNEEYFLTKLINQIEFGHAHNFYLFLFTDLGIIGLITSILIPYTFLKLGNRLLKELKNKNDFLYPIVLGIQASGIALFIRGFFEWAGIFSYGTLTYDLPFWWIFSIQVFLYQKIINERQNIFPKSSHN